jgi:hypothetical protein
MGGGAATRQFLLDAQLLPFHVGKGRIVGKGALTFDSDGGVKRGMLGFQRLDPVLKAHYYPPCTMSEDDRIGRRPISVSEKIAFYA